MSRVEVRRALVSVSDKTGVVDLTRRLVAAGVEIISSGGTAAALAEAGIPVTAVTQVTGAPEALGGRVKTLHPAIHAALLADLSDPSHVADLDRMGIEPIQLVVSNLYPFEATVASPNVAERDVIEQIDIGGPAMVRAAAKNHAWVGVVTGPEQYDEVASAVEAGGLDDDLRARLARIAFFRTARYDAAIVRWMERDQAVPERTVLALERVASLRYGENPHQEGALYRQAGLGAWWLEATQHQGKEMSFNNYLDADAAWRLVHSFDDPACVVVKHTNPCGVAEAVDLPTAFEAAWAGDPLSAFGSVVAVNREVDAAAAEAMTGFIEVVVAPGLRPEAAEILAAKPNLRLLTAPPPFGEGIDLRRVDGGFVGQTWDRVATDEGWRVVGRREPTASELEDLRFAWQVAAHTKSNAIVIARGRRTVGIGAGDQSRVGASERAVIRAGDRARGAVAASDAFFPFRDGIDALAEAGVTAVVEPGGSRRDEEVIAAADEHGVALIFTGRRHFRH